MNPRKFPPYFQTISLEFDPKAKVMVWKFRLKWWHWTFWKKFYGDITKIHVKAYKPEFKDFQKGFPNGQ